MSIEDIDFRIYVILSGFVGLVYWIGWIHFSVVRLNMMIREKDLFVEYLENELRKILTDRKDKTP